MPHATQVITFVFVDTTNQPSVHCGILVLYKYKFLRHVNFEDVTNQAFLQFYF